MLTLAIDFVVDHWTSIVAGSLGFFFFSFLSYVLEPSRTTSSVSSSSGVTKVKDHGPTPQWQIFRLANYFFILVFVTGLTLIFGYYRTPLEQTLAQSFSTEAHPSFPMSFYAAAFAVIFSVAYFLAFFGVGFVSEHVKEESDGSEEVGGGEEEEGSLMTPERKWMQQTKKQEEEEEKKCQPKISVKGKKAVAPLSPAEGESFDFPNMTDEQLVQLLQERNPSTGKTKLSLHQLENVLEGDYERAVRVRRSYFEEAMCLDFSEVPFEKYDYSNVYGSNCEVVVGHVPIPLGLAGPLKINGIDTYLPMATTEGCLIASANRGCKVLNMGGGVSSVILKDSISRAPCLRMENARKAAELKFFLEDPKNREFFEESFNSTTRYGRLSSIKVIQAGRNLYLRVTCSTGDAMGMNMVSKGCTQLLKDIQEIPEFSSMELVTLSGNVCTDKKSSAVNWIEGRGKSVVADAVIPSSVVEKVLKTCVDDLVDLNIQKNLIGSSVAASIGGFNCHAANLVAAMFIATGQDPAQVVESSNCMTLLEKNEDGDLYMSVTMPSVEVGTIGGGTHLPAQSACLGLTKCSKADGDVEPGSRARRLASNIAGCVMAGELSLLAALSTNELVKSHLKLNRRK